MHRDWNRGDKRRGCNYRESWCWRRGGDWLSWLERYCVRVEGVLVPWLGLGETRERYQFVQFHVFRFVIVVVIGRGMRPSKKSVNQGQSLAGLGDAIEVGQREARSGILIVN